MDLSIRRRGWEGWNLWSMPTRDIFFSSEGNELWEATILEGNSHVHTCEIA